MKELQHAMGRTLGTNDYHTGHKQMTKSIIIDVSRNEILKKTKPKQMFFLNVF